MKIAIIPARGGSKRIPRKNIRPFQGRPMIHWPIQTALDTGLFDEVVVSTDDEEIAEVARAAGAITPFLRPKDLADDFTGVIPVIAHAMDEIAKSAGQEPALVCAIYATAPFLRAESLIAGHDALIASPEQAYAISVTEFPFPVQRALKRVTTETGPGLAPMYPEHIQKRSQDLEPGYHDAAQFFWARPEPLRAHAPVFSPRAIPIEILSKYVQDIDTPDDWERAEVMFKVLMNDDARTSAR